MFYVVVIVIYIIITTTTTTIITINVIIDMIVMCMLSLSLIIMFSRLLPRVLPADGRPDAAGLAQEGAPLYYN